MKKYLLAIASAVLLASTSSFAADLVPFGDRVHPTIQVVSDSWNGPYVGASGVYQYNANAAMYGVDLTAGLQTHQGVFLIGGEASLIGFDHFSKVYAKASGKLGVVISDNLATYTLVGYDTNLSASNDNHLNLGAGAEFKFTPNVSVRGQYEYGVPLNSNISTNRITAGLVLSF